MRKGLKRSENLGIDPQLHASPLFRSTPSLDLGPHGRGIMLIRLGARGTLLGNGWSSRVGTADHQRPPFANEDGNTMVSSREPCPLACTGAMLGGSHPVST